MIETALPANASSRHNPRAISGEGEAVLGCEGRVLLHFVQTPDYRAFVTTDLSRSEHAERYPVASQSTMSAHGNDERR